MMGKGLMLRKLWTSIEHKSKYPLILFRLSGDIDFKILNIMFNILSVKKSQAVTLTSQSMWQG